MHRALTFTQIVIAALIGSVGADLIKGFSNQCISQDSKGCAETRVKCIFNNRKTPLVLPSCLTEKAFN